MSSGFGGRIRARDARLVDAAGIAVLYGGACALARLAGFDHVSDDDFARVTIAQSFAHAPRLDPSGTSWLPFPFWILGSVMAVFGRSLAVARATSIALAAVAATTPYLVLRSVGIPRGRALLASAFAFATPWCLWLGAATVPESFTASLTAAGVLGLSAVRVDDRQSSGAAGLPHGLAPTSRVAILSALAIAAACLSRYEPWPIAAVLAVALGVRGARAGRGRRALFGLALVCAVGPLLWMAWNAHAHDGPLHFFRRVSSYKRAIGDGATDVASALFAYPGLLLASRPEVIVPALFLLPSAIREPLVRRRWGLPLLCVGAGLAFLSYGNARDGAPAHHPERALLGVTLLTALFTVDVGLTKLKKLALDGRARAATAATAFFGLAWLIAGARGAEPPGRSADEDRRAQLALGEQLRASGARPIVVTPCAFEHFALIAAYGAPEDVEVRPRTDATLERCPEVRWR